MARVYTIGWRWSADSISHAAELFEELYRYSDPRLFIEEVSDVLACDECGREDDGTELIAIQDRHFCDDHCYTNWRETNEHLFCDACGDLLEYEGAECNHPYHEYFVTEDDGGDE